VTLDSSGCSELNAEALRELVRLELDTLGLSSESATLFVVCQAQQAEVSLRDPQRGKVTSSATVDLASTERGARERLIALSATELIAQAERSRGEATSKAPTPKTPAPKVQETVPIRSQAGAGTSQRGRNANGVELSATATVTRMGHPGTILGGGTLGFGMTVLRDSALWLDLRLERGTTHTTLANVAWTMPSSSAALAIERRWDSWRLGLGAGLRVARLSFRADAPAPDSGRRLTRVWAGAMLPAQLGFALSPRVGLLASFEAGYVLSKIRGTVDDGSTLVEASGIWGSLGLGATAIF
jgi:hypothetical protein